MTPSEILEAPNYELDADMRKVITVRAGGSIRMFVTIRGRPTPEVTWTKEGGIPSDRSSIETTSSYSLLVIDKAKCSDAGKYELLLANAAGTKVVGISVKVLDAPGPVQNLSVKDFTKNSVFLMWDEPKLDGGAAIINYLVEKRLPTRKAWSTVATEVQRESFKITGLEEGQEYFFRVMAENKYGVGEPEDTKIPVKTCETPSAPGSLAVNDVNKSSVTLAWTKPESDGGSPITCYVVEMQKSDSDVWVVKATTPKPR